MKGNGALDLVDRPMLPSFTTVIRNSPIDLHPATFDNDAKFCYNLIIIAFALMLFQKHGVPQSVCMMAAMTLLKAKYSVKTKYGVLSETYSSTADNPVYGHGQGIHMAPALWLIICCLLFEAMSKLCMGAEVCNPRQTTSHQHTGDDFVDDVTNFFSFRCLATMLLQEYNFRELAKGLQSETQT
jgi:hypothetical protein